MVVVLGLSGRGDKDLAAIGEADSRAALGLEEVAR
jgi:tryptophan synthase beta subunit